MLLIISKIKRNKKQYGGSAFKREIIHKARVTLLKWQIYLLSPMLSGAAPTWLPVAASRWPEKTHTISDRNYLYSLFKKNLHSEFSRTVLFLTWWLDVTIRFPFELSHQRPIRNVSAVFDIQPQSRPFIRNCWLRAQLEVNETQYRYNLIPRMMSCHSRHTWCKKHYCIYSTKCQS